VRTTSVTPQALLIPLLAFVAIVALGTTPLGDAFRTFPGFGREEKMASVTLTGIEKPKVEMAIVESVKGMWVRVSIEGKESKVGKVGIVVPASWKLEEVRGIHVRNIETRDVSLETKEFVIPYQLLTTNYSLQFVFTTDSPFDSLHFSHNSSSLAHRSLGEGGPALLKITRLPSSGEMPEEIVKFVEDTVTILL